MASNEIQAIRDAHAKGDAQAEQKAYDKYAAQLTASGQQGSIKPLSELR